MVKTASGGFSAPLTELRDAMVEFQRPPDGVRICSNKTCAPRATPQTFSPSGMKALQTNQSLAERRRAGRAPCREYLPPPVRWRAGFDSDCPEIRWGERSGSHVVPIPKPRATLLAQPNQLRTQFICAAKDTTTQKNADAATLYENVLTIQNVADLRWPATDPANGGMQHPANC